MLWPTGRSASGGPEVLRSKRTSGGWSVGLLSPQSTPNPWLTGSLHSLSAGSVPSWDRRARQDRLLLGQRQTVGLLGRSTSRRSVSVHSPPCARVSFPKVLSLTDLPLLLDSAWIADMRCTARSYSITSAGRPFGTGTRRCVNLAPLLYAPSSRSISTLSDLRWSASWSVRHA